MTCGWVYGRDVLANTNVYTQLNLNYRRTTNSFLVNLFPPNATA